MVLLILWSSALLLSYKELGGKEGNCEEELPKKPVGQLSADCRPTGFSGSSSSQLPARKAKGIGLQG